MFVEIVGAILRAAAERPFLTVVDDQIGSPTCTVDLSRALWRIGREGGRGIWHFAQRGEASWYQFAVALLEEAGVDVEVRPIPTKELSRPAARPAYSVLGTRRLRMELGLEPRPWRAALRRRRRSTYPRPSLDGRIPSAIITATARAWSAMTRNATSSEPMPPPYGLPERSSATPINPRMRSQS